MRIVGGNDSAVTSARLWCFFNAFGETQDYDVTIDGAPITVYTWNDGTSNIGTGNNLSVSPGVTTNYTATLTVGSCTLTSAPIAVNINAIPLAPTQAT